MKLHIQCSNVEKLKKSIEIVSIQEFQPENVLFQRVNSSFMMYKNESKQFLNEMYLISNNLINLLDQKKVITKCLIESMKCTYVVRFQH